MDPVSLVLAALVAGAAAGGKDAASAAVKDAYSGLRSLVTKRLADGGRAREALDHVEGSDGAGDGPWREVLDGELVRSGAAGDEQVLAAARHLLDLLDARGPGPAPAPVDARHARGVVIGNHNTVHQSFGPTS